MGEGYIQSAILKYMKSLPKCRIVNIVGHPMQESGIADTIACYKGVFIALEIKQDSGHIRPTQRLFLRSIRRAGGIGEIVYDLDIVRRIIECIDRGEPWEPVSDLGLQGKEK